MLEHDSQEYENPAMQHDKIKPILFSVIKHSSKEELKKQLPKDIVSGIVVAVVALPLSIALAIASGVGPEAGPTPKMRRERFPTRRHTPSPRK